MEVKMSSVDKPVVLVLGGSGLLGYHCYQGLKNNYNVIMTYNKHNLDIVNCEYFDVFSGEEALLKLLNKHRPDVIINNIPLEDAIMEREGLSVLPTNMELADLELSLATYSERENVLKNVLSQAKGFDYILIDCSPSFNILTVNALNAAQKVIIPLQLEVLSLQGLELITQTIFKVKENLNDNLSILEVLPVMFDESREITSEIYDFLKNNYGFNIFKNKIYEDEKIIETPSFGSSIIAYAPESISASNYQKLAKEVIKKLKEKG